MKYFPAFAHHTYTSTIPNISASVAARSVLVDKARTLGTCAPIQLIPNGIELDQYAPATSTALRARLGVRGPVVGTLANYDNPAEIDILLQIARLLADSEVTVLIAGRGSALPRAQQIVRKESISNVRFVGYVPFSEAPKLVAQFDAGLCVYMRSPMDEARSPMRLLMYSASGIPVVCTGLEEVRRMDFSNTVCVAGNAASFATGIKEALKLPRKRPSQIAAYDIKRLAAQYEDLLQGNANCDIHLL
ncbi:glycosyltransferase [Candidatus Chloroploca sp. Khr17]|uniref:glycosyltransferase n=1 Tax=Candidatus Chloroploca sp. Khr17 TaxID=2496869 RepID=UPI00101C78B6|nr:glycosyltransferase [Candidatus Chloroploca sp. Khr17]